MYIEAVVMLRLCSGTEGGGRIVKIGIGLYKDRNERGKKERVIFDRGSAHLHNPNEANPKRHSSSDILKPQRGEPESSAFSQLSDE
jgi:hypothetical protein